MNAFFVALQFLTRIFLIKQTIWTEESFGKSVKFFPAIGAILGICYLMIIFFVNFLIVGEVDFSMLLTNLQFPALQAAIILTSIAILTGGIHCDGFMDTFDGLFSGRDRDRMLEIMKDSRVGAFGVVSFIMLSIFEFATLFELANLSTLKFLSAIYAAPIISRLMMVLTIAEFRYARNEGMGKAFSEYATHSTLIFATIETLILLSPIMIVKENFFNLSIALIVTISFTIYFGNFSTRKIGGVTGDVYGAVTTITELLIMLTFLF